MSGRYLCIDVGGSSIKYAAIDENLNLSNYGKTPTPYESLEVYLNTLKCIFQMFEGSVDGIGMSIPGIIDSRKGICISGGSLQYANGFHLAEELEKLCHVPVTIMNDAKCAALAESKWGALSDCQDGIVLVFGTGVGGALIKDGAVHEGRHFSAGEFSNIAFDDQLENTASLWMGVSGNPRLLTLAKRVKNLKTDIDGEDVFRWANAGDEKILQVLEEFTMPIARMIFNLQNIFDPERFAIGGGISRQALFLKYIQRNLSYVYNIFPYPIPHAEVVTCKYFNEANLIGAYAHFVELHK